MKGKLVRISVLCKIIELLHQKLRPLL